MKAARQVQQEIGPDTIGYVRVSTEDQAAELKTSLADQRALIAQLAGRLGRTVGQVFEDAGVSGATAEGRPGFTALLAFCAAHQRPLQAPGYVLVLNDSRWGRFRNPEDSTYYRRHVEHLGWEVRFVEHDDTRDVTVRTIMRALHGSQATMYRETLRANTKRGVRGTAAQGFWQNEAPLGYRREATAPGRVSRVLDPGQHKARDERVRLVLGPPDEVALVRGLFARYATGTVSLGSLVRELRATAPIRRWAVQSLAKLFRNETYLGHVIWGRRPHDELERQATPVRPRAEWTVVEDAHPPLVSRDLFDAVQGRLTSNRRTLRRTAGGYALSGLLVCTCGRPYIGGGGPKGPPADPDRYRFYRCSGQKDVGWTCSAPSGILPRRLIEPAIVDAVSQCVADATVHAAVVEELDRVHAAEIETQLDDRRRLDARRVVLEGEQQRMVEAIAAGIISAAEARPTLERVRRQHAETAAALDRTRFSKRQAERIAVERTKLLALAQDFPALARRLNGVELRELLRPWIVSATVDLGQREVRVAIRRIPGASAFCLASPQRGPGGQQDKLIVRCAIPLPPARAKRRRA